MIETIAYKPLARFGKIYYLPTPKGFFFYDKRTKTALYSPAFAQKIYHKYTTTIPVLDEWELPKTKIIIKNWACNLIDKTASDFKYEAGVFRTMGYHYVYLNRPKKFWEGLLNIDKRFSLYVLPEMKIDPKGSLFIEKPPFTYEKTIKIFNKLFNKYLTEKVIYEGAQKEGGDNK